MKNYISLILVFSSLYSISQNNTIGGCSAALGGASSTLSDVWSTQNNQAGLGFVEKVQVGAYYENRFLIKELSYTAFCFAVPIKNKGAFGFTSTSFGYNVFRQSKFGLGYGIKLGENISAGIQMDYLYTQITDVAGYYGKKGVITGEIGVQAKLTKQVIFAVHVFNPNSVKITSYNNEIIPAIMKAGLQYKISDKVAMLAEVEKGTYYKTNFKGGIEYQPAKDFFIRAGASSNPVQMAFGAGVNYQGLKLDLATSWHAVLGFTPQIGLSYKFGKNETSGQTQIEKK
jgi:hypothetical protein